MPKALVNGINMYYEDHGMGFPVILTHGFAGTTRSWSGQVVAFSGKYRFIIYDMRGHGQTEAPASLSQYTLDIVVEDLYQLMRHLRVRKAAVGGLSLGGYLTIHSYSQHPEMTAAIMLMSTGPGYSTTEKAREWNRVRMGCSTVLETQGMKGFMESEYSKDDYYNTPEVMAKLDPRGLSNINRGIMINPWGLDILPKIRVPTIIICGDRDADYLRSTDYMARKIPLAKKVIITNAGHGVNIDQPQVFEPTVLGFLDSLKVKA